MLHTLPTHRTEWVPKRLPEFRFSASSPNSPLWAEQVGLVRRMGVSLYAPEDGRPFLTPPVLKPRGRAARGRTWCATYPGLWRLPLPFFFFSFFSFGLASRTEAGGRGRGHGVWLTGLWYFVCLAGGTQHVKGPFSLCVREMLFLLGDTESSESNDPDLAIEGAGGGGLLEGLERRMGSAAAWCFDMKPVHG